MKSRCPSNCKDGIQRPLESSEYSRLSTQTRGALIFLRKRALVCVTCQAVYVRCPSGTIYLDKLPAIENAVIVAPRITKPVIRPSR
jgi:hypothetical protein